MNRLLLANVDYRGHTSDEGDQFQRGLEHAGWQLAGAGYGDGCRDVPQLLRRYRPQAVVCHDKRDFSPDSPGCFRRDIGFRDLGALRDSSAFKACIVKDAGSVRNYHRAFCEEIGTDAVIVYYDPEAVVALNPWITAYRLVRTYHSVDGDLCGSIDLTGSRARAVVTGALSAVYPIRMRVVQAATNNPDLGISVIGHPGYRNDGTHTPRYLSMLARYKVHVATASKYGFALRKIIESVAMGCTPVTDLPERDVLPEIDGALVRIAPDCSVRDVTAAVELADRQWNLEERLYWAEKARRWYDWRAMGLRLDVALRTLAGELA